MEGNDSAQYEHGWLASRRPNGDPSERDGPEVDPSDDPSKGSGTEDASEGDLYGEDDTEEQNA